jgi:hypothetical protein
LGEDGRPEFKDEGMNVDGKYLDELRSAMVAAERSAQTARFAYNAALKWKIECDIKDAIGAWVTVEHPRACIVAFADGEQRVLILGVDTGWATTKIHVRYANKNGQWSKTVYSHDATIISLIRRIEGST